MRLATSMIGLAPIACCNRTYAQFTEWAVASVSVIGPPSSPSKFSGAYGLGMPPGFGTGQGDVPSMMSLGEWFFSKAAISVKGLNDDPGCRAPSVMMLYCAWSNPGP